MPTITHDYPAEIFYDDFAFQMHGTRIVRWTNPRISWMKTQMSHVIVTATEYDHGNPPGILLPLRPFIGSAKVSVSNIAVESGAVNIRIDVDWPGDLDIYVQIHVINMKIRNALRKQRSGSFEVVALKTKAGKTSLKKKTGTKPRATSPKPTKAP